MARSKMEKEFSEKLNQREIAPSAEAWGRLDAMLTASEQKKTNSPKWYLIAASIIILATISTFFFKSDNVIPQTQVVQQNPKITEQENLEIPQNVAPISKSNLEQVGVNQKKIQKQAYSNQSSINQQQYVQNSENQNQTAIQNVRSQDVSSNDTLNASRANELLADAQTKIQSSTKSISVNAKNLLSQVDVAPDRTFRQKFLNRVEKNYQNVKVALANRNIEDENQ